MDEKPSERWSERRRVPWYVSLYLRPLLPFLLLAVVITACDAIAVWRFRQARDGQMGQFAPVHQAGDAIPK